MFASHEQSGFNFIELYITVKEILPSQQSQITEDAIEEEEDEDQSEAEINVVDEEEEESETQLDELLNNDAEEDDEPEPVPPSQVYNPPQHMTQLNLQDDPSSTDIFYNPYMRSNNELKVGDKFMTKEDCVRAIKKYHMDNSADFSVERTDARRYVIRCRNVICKFRLAASYKKRSDSWEVASIDPPHSCTAANIAQDHRKLGSDLICQDILPMVNKDPSVKVSIIISHIVTRYNYTPSYKKAWITRTKAVEKVYGNWEDSYKELPRYLTALKTYAPDTVAILETLPAGGPDGTLVGGNRIFNRLFWAFKPCIKGFSFCKPIIQIDGTWLYGKYKGTLLMAVAQDGNSNVFPIAFALVEGETADG